MLGDRRGDFTLLINGMPVIHVELKKSGVPLSQACEQIKKYSHEGIFTGLFSLVQIFVVMTPEETLYFANPGPDGTFNPDYYFHWADFNNEPMNNWKDIASSFLSIPMAHQLIGFYTVADDTDGILKVMRSYQYYAASAISDKVSKMKWADKNIYGGYIWHTTGSGKTMTSFKSAQLIASSGDADKVVFLVDRIELGTQSLTEYRNFANENETVQATENTHELITKLKSADPADMLIVTSIQKMSNIDSKDGVNKEEIEAINEKRIVFIVDECHRSTFGEMLATIKKNFPDAIFFGFTGTPIHDENSRKDSTTSDVFGNELHRYSIADGIRDKNVLGFDPYMVCTYKDRDLRKAVALEKARAKNEEDALSDQEKSKVYYFYMDATKVPMAGYTDKNGQHIKGIEDEVPMAQYNCGRHREKVVEDILDNWETLSRAKKFHAILATSSIPECIEYYRLFKSKNSGLKIAALFDQSIDNTGGAILKQDAIVEMLEDYNKTFAQNFSIQDYAHYKADVAARLAHKKPYLGIGLNSNSEPTLDLLLVVDQMLTGFDSKWINTLYLDKIMQYENIIQAFSRTNRLFGQFEKPFGTIRYYRKPHTMKRNIDKAVKLYSGDKPLGLFVDKLPKNIETMNKTYDEIKSLFVRAGIENFARLPDDAAAKRKFASLFRNFMLALEAARIQGFTWNKSEYPCTAEDGTERTVSPACDEKTFNTLLARYKELSNGGDREDPEPPEIPFDIDGYITEISTGAIDSDYMESNFKKWLKQLQDGTDKTATEMTLNELHKSFAAMTQDEQKFAAVFLHDVESGNVKVQEGRTLKDYIAEYMTKAKSDQIHRFALAVGVDEEKLRKMMGLHLTENNINEYGRFDDLKNSADKTTAKKYFDATEKEPCPPYRVGIKLDNLLSRFILSGGFDTPAAPESPVYTLKSDGETCVAEKPPEE